MSRMKEAFSYVFLNRKMKFSIFLFTFLISLGTKVHSSPLGLGLFNIGKWFEDYFEDNEEEDYTELYDYKHWDDYIFNIFHDVFCFHKPMRPSRATPKPGKTKPTLPPVTKATTLGMKTGTSNAPTTTTKEVKTTSKPTTKEEKPTSRPTSERMSTPSKSGTSQRQTDKSFDKISTSSPMISRPPTSGAKVQSTPTKTEEKKPSPTTQSTATSTKRDQTTI